jgi:hypothetical protein
MGTDFTAQCIKAPSHQIVRTEKVVSRVELTQVASTTKSTGADGYLNPFTTTNWPLKKFLRRRILFLWTGGSVSVDRLVRFDAFTA